jgi:hypothetical protein
MRCMVDALEWFLRVPRRKCCASRVWTWVVCEHRSVKEHTIYVIRNHTSHQSTARFG